MKYIVSLSGGNNSLNCLDYCIKKFGKENVISIFADTNIEHKTLYKGLEGMENYFGIDIIRVKSHVYSSPVDVNKKRNLIGHSSVRCTEEMKIKPIKKGIFDHYKKEEFYLVLGYNSTELKRIENAVNYQEKVKEYNLFFPAVQEDGKPISYVDGRDLFGFPEQHVYEKGGRSNNCGGGCFKMSQQSGYKLWLYDKEEFLKGVNYEKEIHDQILINRDKKYGNQGRLNFSTKPHDLGILRKRSLQELMNDGENGIIPVMRKRNEPLGKCKQNGTECGFSL